MAGETAVIIGGASGIGHAVAEAFTQEQSNVVFIDVNPEANVAALEVWQRHNMQTLAMVPDATNTPTLQGIAATIQASPGVPHHVVFAAGVGSGQFIDVGLAAVKERTP